MTPQDDDKTYAVLFALVRVSSRAAADRAQGKVSRLGLPHTEQGVGLCPPAATGAAVIAAQGGCGLDSTESGDESKSETHSEWGE